MSLREPSAPAHRRIAASAAAGRDSPEAQSASTFGILLGRRDNSGAFLGRIISASRKSRSSALLRGYAGALLQSSPAQIGRVSQILDLLEQDDPEIAAEIVAAAVEVTDPVTRLGRMVGAGKLHPGYLQYLHYGRTLRTATSAQFAEVLKVLAPPESPAERLKLAVELIGDRLKDSESVRDEDAKTIKTIQDILAQSATTDDRADYWWTKVVELLAPLDAQWTAVVATRAISGGDISKGDKASRILAGLAATNPAVVMGVVGAALLDPQEAWRWQIGSKREIFSALPVGLVMQWLSEVGIKGARRLARHLPSPNVASDGTPAVPELTERVLSVYGDDAAVLREFAAGRHDMEASWGPVSSHYEGHVKVARAFLNHPLPAIRQWAEREIASAEHLGGFWRKVEEDEGFEP